MVKIREDWLIVNHRNRSSHSAALLWAPISTVQELLFTSCASHTLSSTVAAPFDSFSGPLPESSEVF